MCYLFKWIRQCLRCPRVNNVCSEMILEPCDKNQVYILQLESNKFYVGTSEDVPSRCHQHFLGKGSAWTQLHKPRSILICFEGDAWDEEKYTLLFMYLFGISSTRGSSIVTTYLSPFDQKTITYRLRMILNLCYKCGDASHYGNQCNSQYKEHLPLLDQKKRFLYGPHKDKVWSEVVKDHENYLTNLGFSSKILHQFRWDV